MGLTIHYKISTQRRLTPGTARELVAALRAKAVTISFADLGELMEVGPDFPGAWHFPRGIKTADEVLSPSEGWLFYADPGQGSEGVLMGLCRYKDVSGWRLQSFCKTQYASHHGWEHFLKCHRSVIELLWAAKDLGLRVKVHDEGELWETGSHARLQRNLEKYNQCIAAFGGALKDAAGAEGMTVQSAIHSHPDFERLEAAGMKSFGEPIHSAVKIVKDLASNSTS
jgi:hypothetical protein